MRMRNLLYGCLFLGTFLGAGCNKVRVTKGPAVAPSITAQKDPHSFGVEPIDLPQMEPKTGIAVVILVDTSGSMQQGVKDQKGTLRPKYQIAQEALNLIVEQTSQWKKTHPDKPMQLGIYHFSSHAAAVLPVGDFDSSRAKAAIRNIPHPGGGTAIGTALKAGFQALYNTGAIRKYLICITDGENSAGPPPDRMARQLHSQTQGEVEIHFLAFDVEARLFNYLTSVNGHVVQASDGGHLQKELAKIYDTRILVEAEESTPK